MPMIKLFEQVKTILGLAGKRNANPRDLKNLPLDEQSFKKMIGRDLLYVDKTGYIAKLIDSKLTFFFLSRPRRFGKSLLISTMKEVFSCNKRLFKNLEIYNQIEWIKYPIIHFDFSKIGVDETITVKKALAGEVDKISRYYKLPIASGNHKTKFSALIENLSRKKKKPLVILIDEYDHFIIRCITDEQQRETNRSQLKDFFSVLKGSSEFLRFVFITGVSRFSRVSIFSDLNNLIDLTFNPDYSAIAGYTEKELHDYFPGFIEKFARKENLPADRLTSLIRKWYNGYSWDGETRVYNPFSVLNLFFNFRFGYYWYASSTPTFLIESIRERKIKIQELDRIEVSRATLENMQVDDLQLIPILFQTGYLTIVEKIEESIEHEKFLVDYPNKDVRYSFLTHLLEDFSRDNPRLIDTISNAVQENRMDDALETMKTIFAGVPYNNFDYTNEASYHSLFHIILVLLLDNIGAQIQTNRGRIDQVIETDNTIYIFEFKLENAQKAIDQIHRKKYYEKYQNQSKRIVLVGVSFSKEERNIKDWLIETV
jgi:hypothetical protein